MSRQSNVQRKPQMAVSIRGPGAERRVINSTSSSWAHKKPTFSSLLAAATLFIPLGSGRKAPALTFDTFLFLFVTIPVVTY